MVWCGSGVGWGGCWWLTRRSRRSTPRTRKSPAALSPNVGARPPQPPAERLKRKGGGERGEGGLKGEGECVLIERG